MENNSNLVWNLFKNSMYDFSFPHCLLLVNPLSHLLLSKKLRPVKKVSQRMLWCDKLNLRSKWSVISHTNTLIAQTQTNKKNTNFGCLNWSIKFATCYSGFRSFGSFAVSIERNRDFRFLNLRWYLVYHESDFSVGESVHLTMRFKNDNDDKWCNSRASHIVNFHSWKLLRKICLQKKTKRYTDIE